MLLVNQAMNMFWQAILENSTFMSALLILLVIAWVIWLVSGRANYWKKSMATMLAAGVAVIGFFVIPTIIHSSLADMNYWVDWAFHIATVIALFIYSYLVLLPLLTGVASSRK